MTSAADSRRVTRTADTYKHVTVLGASGGIGAAILAELAATPGPRLRAVSRSVTAADVPSGVEVVTADLTDVDAAVRACAGTDVVVMAAQPPYTSWLSTWPAMLAATIAATEAAGARLVFVDNLYAYAPAAGRISPRSPEHATDPKGALRAALGRKILDAHADGRIRAVIGRFSDYFGPGATNSGLWMLGFEPGSKGRTMRGLFDLDQPHAFHYLPDAARAFTAMITDPSGDGRVHVLPAAHELTQRQMLAAINAQLATPVRVGKVGTAALAVGGLFDPMIRESRSVRPQYDRPWVLDASGFEATYGTVAPTRLEDAIRATLRSVGRAAPIPASV